MYLDALGYIGLSLMHVIIKCNKCATIRVCIYIYIHTRTYIKLLILYHMEYGVRVITRINAE